MRMLAKKEENMKQDDKNEEEENPVNWIQVMEFKDTVKK